MRIPHSPKGKNQLAWAVYILGKGLRKKRILGLEVARPTNGVDFETIGFVEGNGTAFEVSNYCFVDENPIIGINYYRVKQMDFDGQFEYSEIRSVQVNGVDQSVQIYSNPVQDGLTM